MNAIIHFHKGILGMPRPWMVWLGLLGVANLALPLFYLGRAEARIVLAVFAFNFALMVALTAVSGFARLLGLGHFTWFALLYYLWTRLDAIPADDFYGLWLRALMLVNAVSLAIDVVDVGRYAAGDRAETVKGL